MRRHKPLSAKDAAFWKRYKIMEHMHWTYYEYLHTPSRIIDQVWAFMETEQKSYEKDMENR